MIIMVFVLVTHLLKLFRLTNWSKEYTSCSNTNTPKYNYKPWFIFGFLKGRICRWCTSLHFTDSVHFIIIFLGPLRHVVIVFMAIWNWNFANRLYKWKFERSFTIRCTHEIIMRDTDYFCFMWWSPTISI